MRFIATCVHGEYIKESWHEELYAEDLESALTQLLWLKFADRADPDSPQSLDEVFEEVDRTEERFVGCDNDGTHRLYVTQVADPETSM